MQAVLKWLRVQYSNTVNSIAILPAIIASLFLLLSWLMIILDFSPEGRNIKANFNWLRLQDPATARSIISAIVAGIISLTVFSFSMVMIVLNQAASQMSNRVLDKLIGNRSQQWILGFYIGTIVYSLFLLSTIRDTDKGIHVPALSTYLLIALTILDIFLFIYFLHYITNSVKYDNIIGRIYKQTKEAIEKNYHQKNFTFTNINRQEGLKINATISGNYQGFEKHKLLKLCEKENLIISITYPPGTFILKDAPFLIILNRKELSKECIDKILVLTNIEQKELIENNYYYGFRQLKEVAVKALSPGINDPGTAILSLHALIDLLTFRLQHSPVTTIRNSKGNDRIYVCGKTFDEIFIEYLLPIWDYGSNDRSIQQEFKLVLIQLQSFTQQRLVALLLKKVELAIIEKDLKV